MSDYKILVVDDHFLLRQMVTTILKGRGIKDIECAASGAAALESLNTALNAGKPFQVMFLDWSMPSMTGLDVLKICRADPKFNDLEVIMLSAESEDTNIVSALEAGAAAYITKPFKPDVLMQKLDDIAIWKKKAHSRT